MHPYETASDSFIGDDQYHLRRDPSLFTLFFQNKRHKHKIFFPRILDAMSISVCTESHITNFYRIFFAIIIVNAFVIRKVLDVVFRRTDFFVKVRCA